MIPECLAAVAAGLNVTANVFGKRPIYAKMYRTIPTVAIMYGLGCVIDSILLKRKRTRLLAIEHYKKMFPERVPQEEEMYYADVIQPWSPKR